MDLLDKVEGALAGILPGGIVNVRFVASADGTPEQKGAAAALNDFENFDEDCLSGLCQSTGLRAEVLDSEGDILRVYFSDGVVTGVGPDGE